MNDSNDPAFTTDAHPSFVLKFQNGDVEEVDTALLDTDSEDDAPILEVDHRSGTDSDGNVIHRYNITLRETTDDSPNVDLQRSWESDDGVTSDGKNVSMDERSWGSDE